MTIDEFIDLFPENRREGARYNILIRSGGKPLNVVVIVSAERRLGMGANFDARKNVILDWCDDNAEGFFCQLQASAYYAFELESDAVAFKLVWSD